MRKLTTAAILICLLAAGVSAQQTYYSIFSYDGFIPVVTIDDEAASLQRAVSPEMYRGRSVEIDMRWLAANDSLIVDFWQQKGDTVLHIMSELSGIEWIEPDFSIYLMRYFPSVGSPDPLIIPLGGINRGSLTTAVPDDNRFVINLIYQLAGRMLTQVDQSEEPSLKTLARHPLMQAGPYRRDNLAMLLALATSQNIIGIDSTEAAFGSAFWTQNMPGRHLFRQYFKNGWALTPEHTLAEQIAAEPYRSKLVLATRPPRRTKQSDTSGPRLFVEDLPLKGQFGFSLKRNMSNRLEIVSIDTYRLGFACGLREGDIIYRVNGTLVRNHKQFVEKALGTFKEDGATLQIIRDGDRQSIILQDLEIPGLMDDYYFEFDWDSTGADSGAPSEESY